MCANAAQPRNECGAGCCEAPGTAPSRWRAAMSVLELEEALQLDILRRLPLWPHLTPRHGAAGVCAAWRGLVASAPALAARCAVREAPPAAGVGGVFRADCRGDGAPHGELAPRWAPRFAAGDFALLPAGILTTLDLHDVPGVSFSEALVFAAQCERLERLTLERLGDGTGERSRLRGADLELPLQACPHLASVRIVGAAGHDLDRWSCDPASTLAGVGGQLRALSIVDCDACYDSVRRRGEGPEADGSDANDWTDTNDNLISKVAEGVASLEQLDLAGTGCPSNHGVRLIESFLPYLQTLYLSGGHSHCSGSITDRGLAAIAAGCPGMRRFSLRQASKVTQAGAEALLRGCPALQLLSLAGCDYLAGCVDLRGSAPLALEVLELTETYTSDETVQALLQVRRALILPHAYPARESPPVRACRPASTQAPSLPSLPPLTPHTPRQGAPNLRALDVCGCADLTDALVESAAAHCRSLRSLKMAHCLFSNRALEALSACDMALEELVVGRARSATTAENRINGTSVGLLLEAGSARALKHLVLRCALCVPSRSMGRPGPLFSHVCACVRAHLVMACVLRKCRHACM